MHPDELRRVLDAEVGERHGLVVTYAVNSDDAILCVHSVGHVPEPVLVFAEVFCDASDGEDGVNLVDAHGYTAWAEDLDAGGVHF